MIILILPIFLINSVYSIEESIWNNENNIYFDTNSFLNLQLSNSQNRICFKTACQVSATKCVLRNLEAEKMYFSSCPAGSKCQLLNDYSGACLEQIDYPKLKFMVPGSTCLEDIDALNRCGFGPKKWFSRLKNIFRCENKKCKGWKVGDICQYDEDCDVGIFCYEGICQENLKIVDFI